MTTRADAVRILFLALGLLFVGLDLIGAFLPVLPTTPFMIVALACFARSSQQFHDWLFNHPLFPAFSGGTLNRPALQRMLADINACKIDCVVAYKLDRLSSSLVDFTKLMEVFERCKVTFVSVILPSIPAGELERLVLNRVRKILKSPEVVARAIRQVRKADPEMSEREIIDLPTRLDPVWEELFPLEQNRLLKLLVETLVVTANGVDLQLRVAGLGTLVGELSGQPA